MDSQLHCCLHCFIHVPACRLSRVCICRAKHCKNCTASRIYQLLRSLQTFMCTSVAQEAECKLTTKTCDLSKIRINLGKIYENFRKNLKIWANYLKIRAKISPNVIWFWKNVAQRVENHMKIFFSEVIPKEGVHDTCGRKYSHKEFPVNFSGKFGDIRAKTFAPSKICLLLHLWCIFSHCFDFCRLTAVLEDRMLFL